MRGPSTLHRPVDVVLDCRWLSIWGTGRYTQTLLRGLSMQPPDDRWLLWGPAAVEQYAWPGASVQVDERDPRQWRGQRCWFEVPAGRTVVFAHQQRPVRRLPAVTAIHDTIWLRHSSSGLDRAARTAYLRRVATVSGLVLTVSEYSRDCIREDLGVPDDRIAVLRLPVDQERAGALLARRRRRQPADVALYVGRFAPHKNLERLVPAFAGTDFRASGGRLVLSGGSPAEAEALARTLTPDQCTFVEVRPWCDEEVLEGLMADALFLVQPSLEEGFGLPVVEALAGGLPACVSDGGSLPEVTGGIVEPFPARSIDAMAAALDECAVQARAGGMAYGERLAEQIARHLPTVPEFTAGFRDVVEGARERC